MKKRVVLDRSKLLGFRLGKQGKGIPAAMIGKPGLKKRNGLPAAMVGKVNRSGMQKRVVLDRSELLGFRLGKRGMGSIPAAMVGKAGAKRRR